MTKLLWDEEKNEQLIEWIDILYPTLIAYNNRNHEAHGKTPFEVFFGRKPKGAFQTYNPNLIEIDLDCDSLGEPNEATLAIQTKNISKVWDSANTALDQYHEKKV